MIIQVGNNTLDCDVEATDAAFLAYTPNLPWTCDCPGCRNYREARGLIFTEPVQRFFSQFGIDTTKPSEIYEGGQIGEVFHCACWFHFVGAPVFTGDAVEISEAVKVDFHNRRDLLPDSFKGHTVVQLECKFKIPWLLPEPWRSHK